MAGLQSQGLEPHNRTSEFVVFVSNNLDKYECMTGRLSGTLKDLTGFLSLLLWFCSQAIMWMGGQKEKE